jgi:spermidine synthase
MPTQTLLALLPRVYLQSQPQTFLDIGLGTGTTLWVAEKWANHIDSIENNPDVYQAFQKHFFPQLKNSSKINYIFQEARYYLLNSGKKYDIIALEPSYPTDAMTASLYTRESFAQLRASLNVNGLVSLFVPLHVVGFKYAEGILKTLLTEFPYLQIWNIASGDDIVIVAGLKPFTLQPDEVIARIDQYSFPRFGSFGGSLQFAKRNAMLEQIKQSREIPIYTDDSITLELAATRGFLQQVEPKHSTLL